MTKSDKLKNIATAFEDTEESGYFVSLYKTGVSYAKLVSSLDINYKIILAFGPAGSGKTHLLSKFFNEYKEKHRIFFFKSPNFTNQALIDIYKNITKKTDILDTSDPISLFSAFKKKITIILDEAQLYSSEQLEQIRILSNSDAFSFVLCVTDLEKYKIFKDKQFETRIYDRLNFSSLSLDEIKYFIDEKMLLVDASDYFLKFDKKSFKLIHKFTKGNIRDLNRLLNRTFTLVLSNINDSMSTDKYKIRKYIEMAAIDLGLTKQIGFFQWI